MIYTKEEPNIVARFYKVSFEEYKRFFADADQDESKLKEEWENIKIPRRSTLGSAGYDFILPRELMLGGMAPQTAVVATGIRVKIDPGWALLLMPRSSYGMKYGMRLTNTIGLIDSDYFLAKNEGHIMAKITSDDEMLIHAGDRFMQGIFVPIGFASNEPRPNAVRTGGFGSTGE